MNVNKIRSTLLHKREQKGLSAESLGKMVGVNKTTIYRYEKGQIEKMPFTVVNKLAEVLEINPAFIAGFSDEPDIKTSTTLSQITDTSAKLEVSRQKVVLQTAIDQLQEQNKKQNEDRKFPLFKAVKDLKDEPKKEVEINMMAAAGHGTLNFDKENPIETILLPENNIPLNYDYACKVSGNSMEPMYHDGEIIFLKSVHEIRNNMIAVVEINEDCFLKKLSLDKDKLRLISLNNEVDKNGVRLYPDFYADEKDNIFIIGEVVV